MVWDETYLIGAVGQEVFAFHDVEGDLRKEWRTSRI